MLSQKLIDRFPALFWSPDEFDSPESENVRPIRAPLLQRVETLPKKFTDSMAKAAEGLGELGLATAKTAESIKKLSTLLGVESIEVGGDGEPTVKIDKVGVPLLPHPDADTEEAIGHLESVEVTEDGKLTGTFVLHSTPGTKKGKLKELFDKAIQEGKKKVAPEEEPVVSVEKVSDLTADLEEMKIVIAKGLEVPEEYIPKGPTPNAAQAKAAQYAASPCMACAHFHGGYVDPLSGKPVTVLCGVQGKDEEAVVEKFKASISGKAALCFHFLPK